ncbi:hypothetical protein [Paractinoplanes lichenicola]|uniref:Nucleotidyl transferase AbiEii/AbiGii toxin family protein n=1 Tax=Paractinoplanes lichenicola TaxID=2802976 RepID=A0ABS1VDF7_9ACTN|nr:hypothetical protein [Actinoplanes lichenicola]MBL7252727.1 hypothetical protein [Actinoplanes lichenicola]
MSTLRPGADFHAAAQTILLAERRRLATLLTARHELLLVGGSSLPNTLTKGDVDLHLRVPDQDFPAVIAALSKIYTKVHAEIWQSTLATFAVPTAAPHPESPAAATPEPASHGPITVPPPGSATVVSPGVAATPPSRPDAGAPDLPIGVALTPIGSAHDLRFTRTWQLLSADPALVAAYNAVKLRHCDDPPAYEREKSAFFDSLID